MIFRNRRDAGRRLAERLSTMSFVDPVVLALPRGGVPVAAEVASALDAPLDVLVARKVGAPGREEFGIGAIAEGSGAAVMSDGARMLGIGPAQFDQLVRREQTELARRVELYRAGLPLPPLGGRDVIIIDDGLATGVTAEAAVRAVLLASPRRVTLAVPVGAPDTVERLRRVADEVVALATPEAFVAVGSWYDDFAPTSDAEVIELLAAARSSRTLEG